VIESLSAVTLFTRAMAPAVSFYKKLGFTIRYGGESSDFTSFHAGPGYLNLMLASEHHEIAPWGRAIFYVSDVDACHARAVAEGLQPAFTPRDAPWGERYFHIFDPDGHEISLARLL